MFVPTIQNTLIKEFWKVDLKRDFPRFVIIEISLNKNKERNSRQNYQQTEEKSTYHRTHETDDRIKGPAYIQFQGTNIENVTNQTFRLSKYCKQE